MMAYRIVLLRYGRTARNAFSGKSGMMTDGRWHSSGRLLDYAAESFSLATLERLVHYERFDCLEEHVIYQLDLPDSEIVTLAPLPSDWRNRHSAGAQAAGNVWYDAAVSPALKVPSVVSPGECNLLVNARHPRWNWKWVVGRKRFRFNPRIAALITQAKGAK